MRSFDQHEFIMNWLAVSFGDSSDSEGLIEIRGDCSADSSTKTRILQGLDQLLEIPDNGWLPFKEHLEGMLNREFQSIDDFRGWIDDLRTAITMPEPEFQSRQLQAAFDDARQSIKGSRTKFGNRWLNELSSLVRHHPDLRSEFRMAAEHLRRLPSDAHRQQALAECCSIEDFLHLANVVSSGSES